MDLRIALDRLRDACVARFGEPAGVRLAALARPGFDLRPATDDKTTGRCALGGPALLEPGTGWPEYDGFPLSLLAVLDTDSGGSAFGWPVGELGSIMGWQDDHTHLLRLCDGPSEIPTLYFSILTEAFRAGDLSRAVVTQEVY